MENMPPEEELRLHKEGLNEMMRDIARREADAARYGDGEEDIFVSVFRGRLGPDQKTLAAYQEKKLSPSERSLLRNYRRNSWAADVYPLLRQGMSTGEIASALGITEEKVYEAECKLLRIYNEAAIKCGEIPGAGRRGITPETQTFISLLKGHFRVLRQENTGVTLYRFYHKGRLLGTGSALTDRNFTTVLHCGGLVLNSGFDPDRTIVPGISREIVDADNAGAVVARLTYLGDSGYELVMNRDSGLVTVQIRSSEGTHRFFRDDREIAVIQSLAETQHMYDWEMNFCMNTREEIPDETAMLLMSFPLLRFTV